MTVPGFNGFAPQGLPFLVVPSQVRLVAIAYFRFCVARTVSCFPLV
jgi:hypothetical protein